MRKTKWGKAITITFLAYVGIEALFYSAFGKNPVTINNKPLIVRGETTVGKALYQAGYSIRRGALISREGKVVLKNGGKEPRIYINKHPASKSAVLKRDDDVTFFQGQNIKDNIKERLVPIPSRTRVIGSGPFIILQRRGVDGQRYEVYGEKSGAVISSRIVNYPEPTIVKRSKAVPGMTVALTFDDGPNPPYTQRILKILREQNVIATFFVVGSQVQKYPEVVREISESGYPVENHSLTHPKLYKLANTVVDAELDQARDLIMQNTNVEPKWFRPPYGTSNVIIDEAVAKRGYKLVFWTVDTLDWKAPDTEFIWQRFISQIRPGAIVLLHDGGGNRDKTIAILPRIIQYLRDQGYSFVTLDQLYGGP